MNVSAQLDEVSKRLYRHHFDQWQRPPSASQCQFMEQHRQQYCQLEQDAPSLIWLYTVMLDAGVDFPEGEIPLAMKHALLRDGNLTSLSWRFLATGSSSDFRVVLDAAAISDEPRWRWNLLIAWLQILSGLRHEGLRHTLPGPVQQLFLNDGLAVLPENREVQFRGAWMRFATLRAILTEAERRLMSGRLDEFIRNELTEVITWLAATDPEFDGRQKKAGWKYLTVQAAAWKTEISRRATMRGLIWRSPITKIQLDRWTVECVTDAWALHRLALSQRHCADRFLDGCLNDEERILTVSDIGGTVRATIRLSYAEPTWQVSDLRGFANSPASDDLAELSQKVAKIYTERWQKEAFSPEAAQNGDQIHSGSRGSNA